MPLPLRGGMPLKGEALDWAARSPRPSVAPQPVHASTLRCSTSSTECASRAVGAMRAVAPQHRHSPRRTRMCRVDAHGHGDLPGFESSTRVEDMLLAPQLLVTASSQGPCKDDILPQLTPKQLADAIWGFAKQGHTPTEEFMDVVAQEVLSKLDHFRSQDLSNTIWALAVLKYQPDAAWWEEFERQVYKNVTDFTVRELANLMWALAVLEHRPKWMLDSVLDHALDSFQVSSANSLHLLIWSLGKLGHVPSEEWMEEFQSSSQAAFFQFTPSEMANVIWALAKLGATVPSMWLDNFLMVAQWRFPSFSAKLLSILVWSTAMLDHHPSQEWMLCFEQQVREKFDEFSGQELACIAWALRRFGYDGDTNAVFYMLERQDNFREVDFEILGNSKLLGQVMTWCGSGSGATGPQTN